jgi:hypothetical protein
MSGEHEFLREIDPEKRGRETDVGVQALYQAATRLADARRGAPRFKTRDLVGLLLSHGARTWRNSQPHVTVRLKVRSPEGCTAVRVSLGPTQLRLD